MTVAFDNATFSAGQAGVGTSFTFTHAIGASATDLAIGISAWANGVAPATAITSVTVNGVSMGAAAISAQSPSNQEFAAIWGMASPPAGTTVTIVVNLDASVGTNFFGIAVALSVTGGNTSTCFDHVSNASTGSTANPTSTVSSATGELVVDIANFDGSAGLTWTPGGGQTSVGAFTGSSVWGMMSYTPGASSVSPNWTNGGTSGPWAAVSASFKAPGGAAARTPTLTLMGVG